MATKKKEKEQNKIDFNRINGNFNANLSSLEMFVKNLSPAAEKQDKATKGEIDKIIKEIAVLTNTGKPKDSKKTSTVTFQIKDNVMLGRIMELVSRLPRVPIPQAELLYRSSFVMLVSYFDFLISDLIHYFHHKYPDSLSGKELSLTLSELKILERIEDAINFLINRETDNILYDSLAKQRLYFKNTLKIDLGENILNWDKLTEAVERRHIVVHNNCKINRRYLSSVDISQVPEKSKALKEGASIQITEKYFRSVFHEIYCSGLALLQTCWRKWEKDTTQAADAQLNVNIFDALVEEDWACAERLALFSKQCDVKEHAFRLTFDINYCQALKWQGKQDEFKEQIEKFDISALSPKFRLAIFALKNNDDKFYSTVESAITVDEMREEYFMNWPIFRELRKNPDYYQKIHAVFNSISETKKTVE